MFVYVNVVLMLDGKNIYVWLYCAWFVERCDAWEEEMVFMEEMLVEDWMNNSVWNVWF